MPPKASTKINFAKSYSDLQKIVEWFEKGEVDLEEGVKKFEEGLKLVGGLKRYLQNVENRVRQIKEKFANVEEAEEEEDSGKLF